MHVPRRKWHSPEPPPISRGVWVLLSSPPPRAQGKGALARMPLMPVQRGAVPHRAVGLKKNGEFTAPHPPWGIPYRMRFARSDWRKTHFMAPPRRSRENSVSVTLGCCCWSVQDHMTLTLISQYSCSHTKKHNHTSLKTRFVVYTLRLERRTKLNSI